MKIAFVGLPAVGKDVVSDYIAKKYSLKHISSGDIVRDYVKTNNLGGLERENLRIVANKMRSKFGGDILVKIAFEKSADNIVLSGLRSIEEINTFKKFGGKVISINAPLKTRYELAKIRRRIDDNISFKEFKKNEGKEYSNLDINSQNIYKVIQMADDKIINDGSLQELLIKSEKIVNNYKS